jgi:hypothetical protein
MGRKQNPAYADLLRPDETDWRSLRDSGERRRIQNRLAQRAYREHIPLILVILFPVDKPKA